MRNKIIIFSIIISTSLTEVAYAQSDVYIKKSEINAPYGVSGLDGQRNVTSSVDAVRVKGKAGVAAGQFQEMPSYGGVEIESSVFTIGYSKPQNPNGNWDVPWDYPTLGLPWQNIAMFGGHHADDKAYQWTFGQPVSGGLGAVVNLVAMNGMSAGQGTGVTAGGWNGLVHYGELDAVAREEKTGSAPPRFIASSAIEDPDHVTHSVIFTPKGAKFSPALPVYWGKMLMVGMNIATNEQAVSPDKLWGNNWLTSWLTNSNTSGTFTKVPSTWMGTIASWHNNSDGSVDSITLDGGWALYNQATFGFGDQPSGLIPGKKTLDGSTPSLDTTFSKITEPAVFFGVYTKAFPNYQVCELSPMNDAHGDINNPNGQFGNQVHQCANEWDFWNQNSIDYTGTLQGLSIDIGSKSKLTNDSYGVLVSGGGALPLGFIAANMSGNAPAFYSPGMNELSEALFSYDDLGISPRSFTALLNLGFASRPGQNYTGNLRFVQYRDETMISNPDPDQNTKSQSVRLMYTDGVGQNNGNPSTNLPWDPARGALGGQIVWNPRVATSSGESAFFHGLGFAAGGAADKPNYGLIIDRYGNNIIPPGRHSDFMNDKGEIIGSFNYSSTDESLVYTLPVIFKSTVSVNSDLVVDSKHYFRETLTTPSSSKSSCIAGQFTDDSEYHYVCASTNKWKRVALSDF